MQNISVMFLIQLECISYYKKNSLFSSGKSRENFAKYFPELNKQTLWTSQHIKKNLELFQDVQPLTQKSVSLANPGHI